MNQALVYEGHKAVGKLDELGDLTPRLIEEVMLYAYGHAADVTVNEPPNAFGWILWAKATRAFREKTKNIGWEGDNSKNFPTTTSLDKSIIFTVSGGDQNTGKGKDYNPTTISPKGPMTCDFINKTHEQLSLFDENVEELKKNDQEFWILLYHVDRGKEIRIEISRPLNVKEGDTISQWEERIILPAISLTGLPIKENMSDEIDIEIPKRGDEAV